MRGTEWVLVELRGAPVAASPRQTLTLGRDGRLSGSGGCNGFGAGYRLRGGDMTLTAPIVSTQMGCAPDIMARETGFLRQLNAGGRIRISWEGNFRLTAPDGAMMRLRADVPKP